MKQKTIAEMSTRTLEKEFAELDSLIEEVDCFGVGDVIRRELIAAELDKREYAGRTD